jgi:DNA-binding transcriptional regulator/RsmH inhibitor MraZ
MPEHRDNASGNLVDLAWGKLEDELRSGLDRHLESCDECRAELDELRSLRATVRSVTDVGPSAGFHARVVARVKDAQVKEARAKGRARPTPAAPAALPAAGPASRRLAVLAERDRTRVVRPYRRMFAFVGASAVAATAMLAFQMWKVALSDPPEPTLTVVDPRPEGRITMARWRERQEPVDLRRTQPEGATIDVAGLLDDGDVVLTGVVDLDRHEKCLMAFKPSDWAEYARLHGNPVAARERSRFAQLDSNRRRATVRAGKLKVPKAMLDRYVGETSDVVVVRLGDRAEIWSREAFDAYRRILPQIQFDPRDVGSLAVPRPRRRS